MSHKIEPMPLPYEIILCVSELIDLHDGDEYSAADEALSALNCLELGDKPSELDGGQPLGVRKNSDKILHVFHMLGEFYSGPACNSDK